jgi:hypothetical protein
MFCHLDNQSGHSGNNWECFFVSEKKCSIGSICSMSSKGWEFRTADVCVFTNHQSMRFQRFNMLEAPSTKHQTPNTKQQTTNTKHFLI